MLRVRLFKLGQLSTTEGALQSHLTSVYNGFIAKLSSTGTSLMYSTLIGGNGGEQLSALTIDSSASIFLTGFTFSTDFPTTRGAFQTQKNNSSPSVLVSRIRFSPRITAAFVSGKKLYVSGKDFEEGSVIVLEGEDQKTSNDVESPATLVIAKKAGKKITPGQQVRLQV